jgi:hypothetical protein
VNYTIESKWFPAWVFVSKFTVKLRLSFHIPLPETIAERVQELLQQKRSFSGDKN